MKTIHIKMENRSGGSGRAVDELWDSWKLLDNGTFQETDEDFVLTNQNGEKFIAAKRRTLCSRNV